MKEGSSKKRALVAVVVLSTFSVVFIGVVLLLDGVANRTQGVATVVGETVLHDPFYVLLIGSDSRKGTALYTGKASDHAQIDQHADVMTLMRIDPRTYAISLVSIPRDTLLLGAKTKMCDSLLSNEPEKVVAQAEKLTGVEIGYYMMTTFPLFESLINAMDGVVVDVQKTVTVPDPLTAENLVVSRGERQVLKGPEALALARARKEYVYNQDALRQVNVRSVEVAMLQKALEVKTEEEANALILNVANNTITNLDSLLMGFLILDFINHKEEVTLSTATGPYVGSWNGEGLWVVDEDPLVWRDLMNELDAGKDASWLVNEPHF